MLDEKRRHRHWNFIAACCFVTFGLVTFPTLNLHAQEVNDADLPDTAATISDESDELWQKETVPFELKLDAQIESLVDDAKEAQQFEHSLFMPSMSADSTIDAAAVHATWRVVLNETFESTFPSGNWSVRDYNGPNVGTHVAQYATRVWDDNSTRAYQGSWSANPTNFRAVPTSLTSISSLNSKATIAIPRIPHLPEFGWTTSSSKSTNKKCT